MNCVPGKLLPPCDDEDDGISERDALLERLAILARLIRIEPGTGRLILENGDSKISLSTDGTIRIEGRRIVHMADRDVVLNAAAITLN